MERFIWSFITEAAEEETLASTTTPWSPHLPPPFTTTSRWQNRADTYDTFMKSTLDTHTICELDRLNEEHDNVLESVTHGLAPEDRADTAWLLDTLWSVILQREQDRMWKFSGENVDSSLTVYLSSDWVHVAACTKAMGYINIRFGNPEKTGFASVIKHSDGTLVWSHEYDTITKDDQGNPVSIESVRYHILDAVNGNPASKQLIAELFRRVKQHVDLTLRARTAHVTIVAQSGYNFKHRALIQECCTAAGFERAILFNESYVIARNALAEIQKNGFTRQPVSILVVNTTYPYGLKIYGYDVNDLQILAEASCIGLGMDCIKKAYRRAISRLSSAQRILLGHYIILHEYDSPYYLELNAYLGVTLKLKKIESVSMEESIHHLFAHLQDNPSNLRRIIGDSQGQQPGSKVVGKSQKRDGTTQDNDCGSRIRKASRPTVARTPLRGHPHVRTKHPDLSLDACHLIANCVARENGTVRAEVDRIKEGALVLARTDAENLTMGQVGATCKVNGFGDRIFVAVKFRKHLPLGSSGIRIKHVGGRYTQCDICKGRKCLFIPLEVAGKSKDYLFEVQ